MGIVGRIIIKFLDFYRIMRKILLILFLLAMVTSKSFLIETKEDSKADENHGMDYSLPSKQQALKKYTKKCKDLSAASKSKFCQKWINKCKAKKRKSWPICEQVEKDVPDKSWKDWNNWDYNVVTTESYDYYDGYYDAYI